ncbi:sphingomyelin phosphodiesterase 5-like [Eudromia elegans]
MVLRESPFGSRALAALDALARALLLPALWATDRVLDLQPTTAERRRLRRGRCGGCCGYAGRALAGLACAALLLLALPPAALGLLLWLPLQVARRPFAYQRGAGARPAEPWALRRCRRFTFVSANLCLLPSGLAKFSNLGETPRRAAYAARQLAPGARDAFVPAGPAAPPAYGGTLCAPRDAVALAVPEERGTEPGPRAGPHRAPGDPGSAVGHEDTAEPEDVLEPGDTAEPGDAAEPGDGGDTAGACGSIMERFPADADFVCLQEVFDAGAAAALRRRLAASFEHVLYDVGAYGLHRGSLKLLNSGLFLASRYPLLAARYHCYPNGAREDALAAKGLLCVQVLLGSAQGRRLVGYVSCTHLQAPAGDAARREAQLTLALHWAQLFQDAHAERGDVVAFDVFCGDLNFDNCSRADEQNQRHRLFDLYQDPCRVAPGRDQPWAIGTLLNYLKIYEEPVSTPERLKRTLSQPSGRRSYLAGPVLPDGRPDPAARGPCRGRRLDYILYREHWGPVALRTAVESLAVVTQLAARSDHLPVVLRLAVGPAPP